MKENKDSFPRFTLRISRTMLDKLEYVADFEGRTKNRGIEQLIKKRIAQFEAEYGPIQLPTQEGQR